MTLKDRIQAILKGKNIPAMQMEQDLGLAKGYISKLDKSSPNSDKLLSIADYLGVSLDYLIKGEDDSGYYINPQTAAAAQELFENKDLRILFDAVRDAEPEDLRALHSMALALKRKERKEND